MKGLGRSTGISLANKNQTVSLHLYEPPNMIKFKETESRMTVARGWAKERRGLVFNGAAFLLKRTELWRWMWIGHGGNNSECT